MMYVIVLQGLSLCFAISVNDSVSHRFRDAAVSDASETDMSTPPVFAVTEPVNEEFKARAAVEEQKTKEEMKSALLENYQEVCKAGFGSWWLQFKGMGGTFVNDCTEAVGLGRPCDETAKTAAEKLCTGSGRYSLVLYDLYKSKLAAGEGASIKTECECAITLARYWLYSKEEQHAWTTAAWAGGEFIYGAIQTFQWLTTKFETWTGLYGEQNDCAAAYGFSPNGFLRSVPPSWIPTSDAEGGSKYDGVQQWKDWFVAAGATAIGADAGTTAIVSSVTINQKIINVKDAIKLYTQYAAEIEEVQRYINALQNQEVGLCLDVDFAQVKRDVTATIAKQGAFTKLFGLADPARIQ